MLGCLNTEKKKDVAFLLCLAICIFKISQTGACTFPSDLVGDWEDSLKGTLTFTTTTIQSWAVTTLGSFSFTCYINTGSVYISKSASFSYLGLTWNAYLCMDFTKINAYAYYYYLGSSPQSDAGNDQVKIFVAGTSITQSTICDSTAYTDGTYNVVIKKNSLTNSRSACPQSLQTNRQYTFDDGSGNTCGAGSFFDGCSDTYGVTFNRTVCSTSVAYSASGVLQCIYSKTVGSSTYVTLYNTDATTDGSSTYQFTCVILSTSGANILMTQYPRACLPNQTSSTVTSPGATLVLTNSTSCVITPPVTVVSSASIGIGIFFGIVGIILIALLIGWLVWRYKKKQNEKSRGDSEHAPITSDNGVDGLDPAYGVKLDGLDGQPLSSQTVLLNVSLLNSREGESETNEENKGHTYHVIGKHPGSVNDQVGKYVGRDKKKFSSKGNFPGKTPGVGVLNSQRAGMPRSKAVDGQHLPPIVEDISGGSKSKLARHPSNRVFPHGRSGQLDAISGDNGGSGKRVKPIPVRQLKKTIDDKKPQKKVSKNRMPKETKENEEEDDLYIPPATPIKVTRVDIPALSANSRGRTQSQRADGLEVVDLDGGDNKTSVSRGRSPYRGDHYPPTGYDNQPCDNAADICIPWSEIYKQESEYQGNPYDNISDEDPTRSASDSTIQSRGYLSGRSRSVTPPRQRAQSPTPRNKDGGVLLGNGNRSSRRSRNRVRTLSPVRKPAGDGYGTGWTNESDGIKRGSKRRLRSKSRSKSRSRSRSRSRSESRMKSPTRRGSPERSINTIGMKNRLMKFWVFLTKPIILYTRNYNKRSLRGVIQSAWPTPDTRAHFNPSGPDSLFDVQSELTSTGKNTRRLSKYIGNRKNSFGLAHLDKKHISK